MLVLFHGAHRWQGPPRIVPSRKGHIEYGPGLYLTTRLATARSYAKGGGKVLRFWIEPKIRWLEDIRISPEDAAAIVREVGAPKTRERLVLDDLQRSIERSRPGALRAVVPVNLLLYHHAVSGQAGPRLVDALVRRGIDASIDHKGLEDWVVLFNLDKIVKYEAVGPDEIGDAPRIEG